MKTIFFDLDGTLAALFFVKNFSEMLKAGDMTPYLTAGTLFDKDEMAETITALRANGYDIGVISYADEEHLEAATTAKMTWLAEHFPYATAEKIHIVTKATAKETYYTDGDILVDDAKANREAWEKWADNP